MGTSNALSYIGLVLLLLQCKGPYRHILPMHAINMDQRTAHTCTYVLVWVAYIKSFDNSFMFQLILVAMNPYKNAQAEVSGRRSETLSCLYHNVFRHSVGRGTII